MPTVRNRIATWLLAETPSARPDPKETAGHGGGLVSDAYFGSVKSRVQTYNPDKVGVGVYDKMLIDPTLKACLSLMRFALKTVPWDVEGPDDDVTEFVRAAISPVWGHVLDSFTYGIAYGCAPNELVWQRGAVTVGDRDIDGWTIAKVKDIKPSSLRSIDVDGFENFAGYTLSVPQGHTMVAEKALHYTHDMAYGNLWGSPRLRSAYDAWYSRSILQALYLRFMERRVVPAVLVEYPNGYAEDGQTPNASIASTIAAGFQSDATAIHVPSSASDQEGWGVSLIEDAQRAQVAQAFLDGMRMLDLKMMTAMLTPEKVLIGDAGAYALSETHKDVWLLGVEGTLEEMVECVNDQLVPRLVRYTFGDAPSPRIVPSGLSDESRALLGTLLSELIRSGKVTLDGDGIAERLDIPTTSESASEDDDEVVEDMPENPDEEPVGDEMSVRKAAALLRDEVQRARLRLASRV